MSQQDQIDNFLRLSSLYGTSQTLLAAQETGLLDALNGPPRTADELSEACRMPRDRLQLVLDVLVDIGAIERYGDDYALSTAVRLACNQPDALHGARWGQLAAFLRDEPAEDQAADDAQADGTASDAALHAYRGHTMGLQWTMTAAAMELAELLGIGHRRQGVHILDLGAGSAMWSCALAYRDSAARITAIDVPAALTSAERTAREVGIDDRFEFLAGDYRQCELPRDQYDLVLAVNLLQLAPLEASRSWLERARDALRPAGGLVLVGMFAGAPHGDFNRHLAALELSLRVPGAKPYDADEVRMLLDQCGFDSSAPRLLAAAPHWLGVILARPRTVGNAPAGRPDS